MDGGVTDSQSLNGVGLSLGQVGGSNSKNGLKPNPTRLLNGSDTSSSSTPNSQMGNDMNPELTGRVRVGLADHGLTQDLPLYH